MVYRNVAVNYIKKNFASFQGVYIIIKIKSNESENNNAENSKLLPYIDNKWIPDKLIPILY